MVIWYGRTPITKFRWGGGGRGGHNKKDESRPEKYNLCVVLVDSVDCPCLGHKMLHVLHKYILILCLLGLFFIPR